MSYKEISFLKIDLLFLFQFCESHELSLGIYVCESLLTSTTFLKYKIFN